VFEKLFLEVIMGSESLWVKTFPLPIPGTWDHFYPNWDFFFWEFIQKLV
jgi:hypothetical protein